MFVKLVDYLDGRGVFPRSSGDLVVPTANRTFEVVDVDYRKVSVINSKEFDEAVKDLGEWTVYGHMPELCSCTEDAGEACNICGGETRHFEFLIISLHDERTVNIVAPGCTLFIMNNEGKTIDRLVCH